MGRKSIKENKNKYFEARENAELSREKAAEKTGISAERIRRIETDSIPKPDEVNIMSKEYNAPLLCNYFCSQECAIGMESTPSLEVKSLSEITLGVLSSLNSLEKEKDKLIDIAVDGVISDDELEEFKVIQKRLEEISIVSHTMNIWFKKFLKN